MLCVLTSLTLPAHAYRNKIVHDTTANREQDFKPLTPFLVPKGTVNLARGKTVTSSDEYPIIGALSLITDGDKDNAEEHWVELGPGSQWVQIDLLQPSQIFGIQIWHYYGEPRVYRDVVVRVSNDPTFVKGVRTVHNNDRDNSSGLGVGTDREVFESHRGFRIDTRGKNYEGLTARYVRLYSKGNSSDPQNQYIEVEVIGKPPGPPRSNDVEARRRRGELKTWTFQTLPRYVSRWHDKGKPAPLQPADFLVPADASDIRYDGTALFHIPSSRSRLTTNKTKPGPLKHLNLPAGSWWMQIDFGELRTIYAIQLQGDHKDMTARTNYIVLAADDEKFTGNVQTLFDNANSQVADVKRKPEADANGLLIDTRGKDFTGLAARYLRVYSRTNSINFNTFFKGECIGKKLSQHSSNKSNLILWQTQLPPQPYW